ncbi:hypothetical protein FOL47_010164 [Perkinsus chesapeaki]|uniref:PNPLA domain-containing protein n=1 Tax=Perkinsus chesapeaki TaxID=330153 RepID=A0A7J6L4Q0_PERCH|nr:hypothetical protein FOL47_010164 [Perkinsus chesapeaki]
MSSYSDPSATSSDAYSTYVLSVPLYAEGAPYLGSQLEQIYEALTFYIYQNATELAILALTLLALSLVIVSLCVVLRRPSKGPVDVKDKRPTLALGGTGLRIGYEFGCIAALQDYVDLSDVRITTVSGSIFAGLVLASPKLDIGRMIKALLNVRDQVMNGEHGGCYLMDPDGTVALIIEELHKTGGLTEDILKEISSGDLLRIGITSFCPWPTTRCVKCPDNFEDLHNVMAAAICIPPFFNRFPRFEGRFAADAAFSSWFAVPNDSCPDKVVKLAPFFIPWARFRSELLYTYGDVCECIYPFGIDRQLKSFAKGYSRTKSQLRTPGSWQNALDLLEDPTDMLNSRIASIRRVVDRS